MTKVSTLHRDALGSVRAVTNAAGLKAERSLFRPYGEEASTRFDLATAVETKGFIGQRMDADAGLQYLNARYYDPKLGMFIQPDWWDVTRAGVGTNRYKYSYGDPINQSDPGGHSWLDRTWDRVFGSGSFNRTFGDKGSRLSDRVFGNSYEKSYAKFNAAVQPQAGYPKTSYPEAKRQFAENSMKASGQAASGDAIFDIIGGAGIAKQVVQLGFKGIRSLFGGTAAKALSIRTVGELGEAAVRAAHDIGPKEMVEMFGRRRYPDGILPGVVSEVKNVAKLSYTRQLRDYAAFAADPKREFHLYVRSTTHLAGTLVEAIENNSIILRIIPE